MTDPILAEMRLLRMHAGLRQVDVAKAAGVDPASISYWENGHSSPHLDLLRRYMHAIGYDLAVVPLEGP